MDDTTNTNPAMDPQAPVAEPQTMPEGGVETTPAQEETVA